jgi:Na+/phosphate symporter
MFSHTLVSFLVAVVGLLIYGFANNPKVAEVGRLLFFIGALWLVRMFANHSVDL